VAALLAGQLLASGSHPQALRRFLCPGPLVGIRIQIAAHCADTTAPWGTPPARRAICADPAARRGGGPVVRRGIRCRLFASPRCYWAVRPLSSPTAAELGWAWVKQPGQPGTVAESCGWIGHGPLLCKRLFPCMLLLSELAPWRSDRPVEPVLVG